MSVSYTHLDVYKRQAFVTSATQIAMPVVSIDSHTIGDGKPGPLVTALRREFHRFAEAG